MSGVISSFRDPGVLYDKNVVETMFDKEANKTWDVCNICGDTTIEIEIPEELNSEDKYWTESYNELRDSGAIESVDEVVERATLDHLLEKHEGELTLLSMDIDNKELLKQIIGDKADEGI